MKKFLSLVLFVCALLTAQAFAHDGPKSPQSGADVYYRDGARFALEGRLPEAAKAFEQAVALDPDNGNAYFALGNVYAEMGRWADAVNAYYKAVSLNKNDVEAHNNLGVALGQRGQHAQAAAAFERAIKIYPKWAEPYYHLGEERRAMGQEAEARAAFERALRLRPDYAARPPRPFPPTTAKVVAPPASGRILDAMNAVNLGAGATESAVAAPEKPTPSPTHTADSTPSSTTADARAAAVETNASAAPVAAPAPATSSRPAPTSARPTPASAPVEAAPSPYDLGVKEARAGRYREAVAAFRQAVLLERTNARAYRALGDAYAALNEWRESVDAYEQAARLAPDDAEVYEKLGRSYARLRETTNAAGDSEAATNAAGAKSTTTSAPTTNAAANLPNDPDPTAVYRVGPGDVLDVRLLGGRGQRATSSAVSPTGLLDYPALREPLQVTGLTTDEVAARLGSALNLRAAGADSEVAVGVREYVSHAIIVGGMVKEGGTKILQREGVPLYVIIAYAQPLPGAGQAVVVSRATGRTTAVDLSDSAALKTLVRPGDVVTVRELPKQFVYVAGAVREPGQKEFHTGLTLTQLLLAAGGTQTAGNTSVTVTRQEQDGRLSTAKYSLAEIKAGRTPDPTLRPGDRVEVIR
ncbi:MAG TPA: tetratricopeptide repeat protein [Pyrinomonadaceae bacterium]|nr:tetratricopeptide repeat protein [Pyrinomonadaceae bacterium]